ncbi:major facilitator superfamily domain-containing protein [Aspergillus nidulans var. acristatus]
MAEAGSNKETIVVGERSKDSTDSPTPSRRETFQPQTVNAKPPRPAIASFFSFSKRNSNRRDPEEIATPPCVYDDPKLAPYFQPNPKYENLHRFDPAFRWKWGEEKPLIRKIDWKVTVWAALAFFALDLDRSNIGQANTDNFLDDMGLDTNDYNLGQTLFKVAFLLSELPSQLVSKKIGPDRWIPAQMCLWSIASAAQFWLNSRASFLALRVIIGALQGGFIPDIILYLSYFFKSDELPLRLAIFWMANRLTDVISPLIAYGVLHMRGTQGQEGWRWLFLIEGFLTLLIGIWSIFQMAPSPTQTKAFWRPNGWFNEHEEKIMVNRILRDDPSKGDMHNREAITPKLLWWSLCDYDLWPIYAIGLTFGIPPAPSDQYLTLTLRGLGFDTFESNLLSIPAQIFTTINMLILTYISVKWNQRAFLGLFTQFWFLPCLIALAVLPEGTPRWGSYALVTVILSYPSPHPMQVGWCSSNSNTVRTRTVSAALYNMMVQLQSIISSNIYREDDKPLYRRGNRVLIAINCLNVVLYLFAKWYYRQRNKKRDAVWNRMSSEEKEEYLNTTTDQGNKRLDFRFAS